MAQTIKSWATPLAVGAFIISGVTGLLIFFDLELGIIEPVHKWASWLFVTGVMLHLVSNWKQFIGYFSKKPAIGIIGAALIVTATSVLPIFGEKEEEKKEGREKSGKIASQLLESSSLETIALVAKTTPKRLVEQLGACDYGGESKQPNQSHQHSLGLKAKPISEKISLQVVP